METFSNVVDVFARSFNGDTVFLDSDENTSGSALGGWINVALLAIGLNDQLFDAQRGEVEQLIGCSIREAEQYITSLIEEKPEVISFAVALWYEKGKVSEGILNLARKLYSLSLSIEVDDSLPSDEQLDAWVSKKTLNIINSFPVELSDDVVALLVNAVATKISWHEPYDKLEEEDTNNSWGVSSLLTDGSADFKVSVTGEGLPVLVNSKFGSMVPEKSDDNMVVRRQGVPVVVYTAIGNDGVSFAELYDAILVAHETKFARQSREEVEKFLDTKPDFLTTGIEQGYGAEVTCNVTLPAWSAETNVELNALPSYSKVQGLWENINNEKLETKQATVVKYDRLGYEAASVTSTVFRAAGMPRKIEKLILDVKYDKPFVSVAFLANVHNKDNRSEVWNNVPLFTSVVRVGSEVSQ